MSSKIIVAFAVKCNEEFASKVPDSIGRWQVGDSFLVGMKVSEHYDDELVSLEDTNLEGVKIQFDGYKEIINQVTHNEEKHREWLQEFETATPRLYAFVV